ncbi:thiol reductant ABC exporter subunit CydD [Alicyclobacillus mengziensis]|uniref:Thiol reductant ABC exporter subunit CydD n=1 Tax=Alicyclobacillus mengziensis TaxID=2931921 RepID=A0A9X7Z7B4_9BACL|nr:thiol reductant ABC exporter subunit CydD [Alicyclobacillus mengziensis]QSO47043.1 thiol reductant ABC exporter subunit CydD [Alicyclobacillus mengziensis]
MPIRPWLARFPNLKTRLATVVVLNFASGLLMIVQAVLLANLVTDVFLRGLGRSALVTPLLGLLVVILFRALLTGLAESAASQVSIRIREDLRMRLVRHVFALGPVYLRSERTGELLNSALTGVEQVDVYVAKYLPQVFHALFLPFAVWCMVVGTDFWSALILALTAPLIPLFMILIGKGADAVAKRQWRALSLLSGHFLDVVRGLATLKMFNRSRAQVNIIRQITDAYREATMRSLRVAFLSALVLEMLTTLSTAVVAVMLGLRLLNGHIDFHRAFFILLLAPEFYQPIRMIGTQFHASMNGIEAANRIFAVLDTKPPGLVIPQSAHEKSTDSSRQSKLSFKDGVSITFDNVSFTYPGSEDPALANVSFMVPKGAAVAVVGPSGAGKSSLFDLLLGFAEPTAGRILVNGTPLTQDNLAAWRSHTAYVPQRTHLFPGTIADNIRMTRPEASDDDVRQAAMIARADEFVRRLPQGYDTPLGEDVRLSGGQAQRIAIARALLKNAAVVCLDEPTAALDVTSEQALQLAFSSVLRGRTSLIAAHRLQTVLQADLIVVIAAAKVVEIGSHDELLRRSGTYASMWRAFAKEASP